MSDRLHHRFDDLVSAAIVDQVIEEEVGRFNRARVETFVPMLVERAARRRLDGMSAQLSPRAGGPGHSSISAPAGGDRDPAGGGESGPIDADGPERGTSRQG